MRKFSYLEIVNLIMDNEQVLAERGHEATTPPPELQKKTIKISHQLKLLAPSSTQKAYKKYKKLVFQEINQSLSERPSDPNEVEKAREALITAMASDMQSK